MTPILARMIRCSALVALAAGVALAGRPGPRPADEDPKVAAYFKKKGWGLMRDQRVTDGKWLVFLYVENRDKPFTNVTLTPEDYKMIARSKTTQVLNLHQAMTTDDDLKLLTGMPRVDGIALGADKLTDAGMKALARWKSLESISLFTKKVTDAGIKELAALPKLRELFLVELPVNGSCFKAFAGSKTLESVGLISVGGFTDEGARNLARLPNLKVLKIDVGFGENKLTTAGIKTIVDTHLPARFEFDKKLIDDDLLEALVAKGWLYGPTPPGITEKRPATAADVRSLEFDYSKVTDRGMRSVLNCTNATVVSLKRTGVTDETLKKLSAFKKLESLSLCETKVTAAGLKALAGLPIRHLDLQECDLSEDALKALGKMTELEQLQLAYTKLKAPWLKHLAALPKLKELSLRSTGLDDDAVEYFGKITSLEDLNLDINDLTDRGFQRLLKLPKLRALSVNLTRVSPEVYRKAKKEHPKLSLHN